MAFSRDHGEWNAAGRQRAEDDEALMRQGREQIAKTEIGRQLLAEQAAVVAAAIQAEVQESQGK